MGEERARALVVCRVVVPEARQTVVFVVGRSYNKMRCPRAAAFKWTKLQNLKS